MIFFHNKCTILVLICYILRIKKISFLKNVENGEEYILIIGVNLLYLRPGLVGGSEVYVRELIKQLILCDQHKIIIFCNTEVGITFENSHNLKIVIVSDKPFNQVERLFNENIKLIKFIKSNPVDILFSPANFAIPFLSSNINQIVTVHDLQHHWLTEHFTLPQRIFRTLMFKLSFFRCRHIIAISEFTKQDIINRYGLRDKDITVVHHGIADYYLNDNSILEATKIKFGLKEKYFYYPSAMFCHKNHKTILEAFYKVHKEMGKEVQMIFTGAQNDMYPIVQEQIKKLGLTDSVKHLGFVSREEVFAIMKMAKALVFPSEFEGFGFPILEAMRCGTPVLASNTTAIIEVAENAAILINPFNVDEWVNAMINILHDDELRGKLTNSGYEQVVKFTWAKCVEKTLTVFENQEIK